MAHVFCPQYSPDPRYIYIYFILPPFLRQDNGGSAAGFGMVVSWALGLLLALLTVFTMLSAVCGRGRVGFSLTTLSTWTLVFSLGLVVATTVGVYFPFRRVPLVRHDDLFSALVDVDVELRRVLLGKGPLFNASLESMPPTSFFCQTITPTSNVECPRQGVRW